MTVVAAKTALLSTIATPLEKSRSIRLRVI